MRERAEHEFGGVDLGVVRSNEREVAATDSDGSTALLVGRCEGEREAGMAEDECAELAARISAGPEHADWYFIHRECIIMHEREVNPDVPMPGRVLLHRMT